MDERELLEKYEPALRFAKSERFFPMAVEPYLEKCTIFPSGPQGVVGLLSNLSEPLVTLLGKLEGGQYFLRFVNDPLIASDIWIWWGILSAIAIGAGWFASGGMGVVGAAALALAAALIIFIQASPIRLRFFLAASAALFFLCSWGCSGLVLSDTAHLHQRADRISYLVAHLFAGAILSFCADDEVYL